jgi:CBS domain-containing protein
MPKVFETHAPPFDRLNPGEIAALKDALDVGYFRPGETLVARGGASDNLHVIIKGAVEERDGEDVFGLLGPQDVFDSRAVVHGMAGHDYVAREETLCYLIPKQATLDLIHKNPRFAAFFYREISDKLDAHESGSEDQQVDALMRARIKDLFIHPAVFIDADRTIEAAGEMMHANDTNALFVRDGFRTGVVTGMNLSKALVLKKLPLDTPLAEVTHFNIVSISPNDFVFSAMMLMTKHSKRRLAVKDGAHFVGMLEDVDLLGHLAGNSQVTAGRIDRATSIEDLVAPAKDTALQVSRLHRQGVKVPVIAEIVSDLNRRLFARTFDLLAPDELKQKSCLFVMGSEGRGEQTVRTDQDNGLILSEAVDPAVLDRFRADFTAALERFGFPPCPGNVMVRNPLWSRRLADFVDQFRSWIILPDADSHMNVAIFYDSAAVAGHSTLLDTARQTLVDMVRGEKAYLTHFARAIDSFSTPIGVFNQLVAKEGETGDALDLKKGGIFPIVHGIRALALEQGILETSTSKRIGLISAWGVFDSDFARELRQSFHFLMDMQLAAKLAAQARKAGTRVEGEAAATAHGLIRPHELSSIQRDLLRETLHVVKQFREIVRRHFHLSVF